MKYSKRNARIEIPYHVLERLIARDLKLQQIESESESKANQSDHPAIKMFYGLPDRFHYTELTPEKSVANYIPIKSISGYLPSGFLVYANGKAYSVSFTGSPD